MIYRVETIRIEAPDKDPDGEVLSPGSPIFDSGEWRVVAVLKAHQARVNPDVWYIDVLKEAP